MCGHDGSSIGTTTGGGGGNGGVCVEGISAAGTITGRPFAQFLRFGHRSVDVVRPALRDYIRGAVEAVLESCRFLVHDSGSDSV